MCQNPALTVLCVARADLEVGVRPGDVDAWGAVRHAVQVEPKTMWLGSDVAGSDVMSTLPTSTVDSGPDCLI